MAPVTLKATVVAPAAVADTTDRGTGSSFADHALRLHTSAHSEPKIYGPIVRTRASEAS